MSEVPKVLVIEDEPISLYLITTLLRELGVSVISTSLGRKALEAAAEEDFDLVLADSQLPDINGLEVIRRLRASEKHATTPIVALSAYFKPEEKQALSRAGVNGYQTKPINQEQLEQLLKTQWQTLAKPSNSSEAIIDWALCLKRAAGKSDLAQEILHALMAELPQTKQALNHALQTNNLSCLESEAHKLHGACCYTGLPQLKQAAFSLEKSIIDGEKSVAALVQHLLVTIDNLLLTKISAI